MEEVRYERLRPRQIVAARQACPAAYLPIGTVEWHGVHNPVVPEAGDHAGYWETSLLMALDPGLTNLAELPDDPATPLIGVGSRAPVQHSSAEFGERAVAAIVERVGEQVRGRLAHPNQYRGHGARL